jgi:hypothetical protein
VVIGAVAVTRWQRDGIVVLVEHGREYRSSPPAREQRTGQEPADQVATARTLSTSSSTHSSLAFFRLLLDPAPALGSTTMDTNA